VTNLAPERRRIPLLDVFEHEPIQPENPLLKIVNKEKLVMVPHITWSSIEAWIKLIDGVRNHIHRFLREDKSED
jgi:lactate dehydrogenase-like 2-hydroxyacid dehydrogenase